MSYQPPQPNSNYEQPGSPVQTEYRKALRVANLIAAFKMIVLIAIIAITVLGFFGGLLSGESSGVLFGVMFLVGGAITAAVYYVLFGWFEHTLRVLVAIADHTGIRR